MAQRQRHERQEAGLDFHSAVDRPIFSARLTPHRSLSRDNMRLLIGLFAGACILTSLPFLFLGAWPVAGFMGLDIALLYWAFRANFRDARASQVIAADQELEDVFETPFEPRKAVADPDVRTLMLGRKTAEADVTPASSR